MSNPGPRTKRHETKKEETLLNWDEFLKAEQKKGNTTLSAKDQEYLQQLRKGREEEFERKKKRIIENLGEQGMDTDDDSAPSDDHLSAKLIKQYWQYAVTVLQKEAKKLGGVCEISEPSIEDLLKILKNSNSYAKIPKNKSGEMLVEAIRSSLFLERDLKTMSVPGGAGNVVHKYVFHPELFAQILDSIFEAKLAGYANQPVIRREV